MENRNRILLILLIMVGLTLTAPACKKYTGPRTLTAQAVDKTNLQPVPDTWLYLLRRDKDDVFNFNTQNYEIIETKRSDAEGKAEFTFNFEEKYTYDFYGVNENGYYDDGNNRADIPYKLQEGKVTVELKPIGFIKFHVKNIHPAHPADKINISQLVDGDYPTLVGEAIDSIICCSGANGNQINRIVWWIYNNNSEGFSTQKEVYIPAHDTILVTIEY